MSEWRLIVADGLVFLGVLSMTLAVAGLIRFRDRFAKLHAGAATAVPGSLLVLAGALVASPTAVAARALLVAAFLMVTAAVGTHALANLQMDRQER